MHQVKTSELDKFKVNITEESKIISFEKSMYRQISEEMINFLSGIKPLNNLIGAPINKYRPNYKLLQHFRQKFFENVENENQFETTERPPQLQKHQPIQNQTV